MRTSQVAIKNHARVQQHLWPVSQQRTNNVGLSKSNSLGRCFQPVIKDCKRQTDTDRKEERAQKRQTATTAMFVIIVQSSKGHLQAMIITGSAAKDQMSLGGIGFTDLVPAASVHRIAQYSTANSKQLVHSGPEERTNVSASIWECAMGETAGGRQAAGLSKETPRGLGLGGVKEMRACMQNEVWV